MSQPDLARVLRDARPVAPPELRERVRLVAARATPPRRRLVTWRRAVLVAVPVAIAVVAGVLATRPTHQQAALHGEAVAQRAPVTHAASGSVGNSPTLSTVAPNTKRIQRYSASLELRLAKGDQLIDAGIFV